MCLFFGVLLKNDMIKARIEAQNRYFLSKYASWNKFLISKGCKSVSVKFNCNFVYQFKEWNRFS